MGINLSEEAKAFLVCAYFGSSYYTYQSNKVVYCAQRAYLDLSRTLDYTYSSTKLEKNKNDAHYQAYMKLKDDFKQQVYDMLAEEIKSDMFFADQDDFNKWHERLCENNIQKIANSACLDGNTYLFKGAKDGKAMTYGQAQKWLNMTLKYLWILGFWTDNNIKNVLHVPVDSYIMEATSKLKTEVKIPYAKIEGAGRYKESKSKKWSAWENVEYFEFQRTLRTSLGKQVPIVWENSAWIRVSEERTQREAEKKRK